MKPPHIVAGVVAQANFGAPATQSSFLTLLCEEFPEFAPEFFNGFEPVNKPFESVDAVVHEWSDPLLWVRRSRPGVEGSIHRGNADSHDCVYLAVEVAGSDCARLEAFVRQACRRLAADFAYIHPISWQEQETPPVTYDSWYPLSIGVNTYDLVRGIPNLGWVTAFGSTYVELIGSERLLSAPGCQVDRADGLLWLKLCDDVARVTADLPAFVAHREAVKAHIGALFFRSDEAVTRVQVPSFSCLSDSAD